MRIISVQQEKTAPQRVSSCLRFPSFNNVCSYTVSAVIALFLYCMQVGMLQRDLNSNTSGLCSSASLECKKSLEEGTDFDLSLLQQEKVLSAESTNVCPSVCCGV